MRKKIGVVIAALAALVLLAGCAVNYAGEGNYFDITANVTAAGPQSVKIDQITVGVALGQAKGWFESDNSGFWNTDDDHHEIHNNYKSDGWTTDYTYVGTAYDSQSYEIALASVPINHRVRLVGKIRANKKGKSHNFRAVFDQLYVLPS